MKFRSFKAFAFLTSLPIATLLLPASCSKSSDNDGKNNPQALTDFQKKLVGRWYVDQVGGMTGTPDDYFEFTDKIIDSLSSDTVVYRVLNQHVVSNGWCNSPDGRWTLRADSTMSMSCLGNVRLFSLTDSAMAIGVPTGYSYFPWAMYYWKKYL